MDVSERKIKSDVEDTSSTVYPYMHTECEFGNWY